VRGIQLETGELFVGDVWLVGDDGVVLQSEELTVPVPGTCETQTLQVIRVDVVGDPLFRRRLCADANLFSTPQFVQRLRVVGPNMTFDAVPDSNGNVSLTTVDDLAERPVLRIRTKQEGIEISAVGSALNT
jgi:hypothetical protein